MKTVILCGGRGTRIRDVADDIPKPMIPLGGLPILWHIMKYYAHWGHDEFVLCLGYAGEVIRDFFLNYDARTNDFTITLGRGGSVEVHANSPEVRWKVTLAETGLNALTGARIKRVEKYLTGEANFMLTYGDGVSNIDLDKLLEFHLSNGKILTASGVRPSGRFGEVTTDSNGLVTEFNEKPQATEGWISGGFFVCRAEIFDYLDSREDLMFEIEPIKQLVRDRQMALYEHHGFWQSMDTYRDYAYLNSLVEKNQSPWMVWK
jgi:glucose-1-phosphate cytidylyltransferase